MRKVGPARSGCISCRCWRSRFGGRSNARTGRARCSASPSRFGTGPARTPSSVAQVGPQLLHLGEEACGFGAGVGTAALLELAQQLLLLLGKIHRRLDHRLDEEVAALVGA